MSASTFYISFYNSGISVLFSLIKVSCLVFSSCCFFKWNLWKASIIWGSDGGGSSLCFWRDFEDV